MEEEHMIRCSFCGTGSDETRIMIVTNLPDGQQIAVCDDCVTTCHEIVEDFKEQDERISHIIIETRLNGMKDTFRSLDDELEKDDQLIRKILCLPPEHVVTLEDVEQAIRKVLHIEDSKVVTMYDRQRWRYMICSREEIETILETADEDEKDFVIQCLLDRFQF